MENGKETDEDGPDIEFENYDFIPVTDDSGITDYSAVQHDRIYLVNSRNILNMKRPSWIPEFDAEELINNSFIPVAAKEQSGTYLAVSGSKNSKTLCRMPADLLAITADYYRKYMNAREAAEQKNTRYHFPQSCSRMGYERYKAIRKLMMRMPEYENDRRITAEYPLSSIKHARIFPETAEQLKLVFGIYEEVYKNVKIKMLDLRLEKKDYADSFSKGRETAYGDSGVSPVFLERYGVMVKKQNGSDFTEEQLDRLDRCISTAWTVYGDLSHAAASYGLKVSYADDCRQHATQAAVGIFSRYHHALGVSFFREGRKDGYSRKDSPEEMTIVHETAHWLDALSGEEKHYKFATDIENSDEKKIAEKFRTLLEAKNTVFGRKLSDYSLQTCECFARAEEEYFALANGFGEHMKKAAYLDEDVFRKEILPQIEEINRKYRAHFARGTVTAERAGRKEHPRTENIPERKKERKGVKQYEFDFGR